MNTAKTIVAINGSPHEGIGNTSQMIQMVGKNLATYDIALDEIFLSAQHIKYCTGCAMCLDKGICWLKDDFKALIKKVLEADAVILASPVYVFHVSGQMKTFLDRAMGYGHRPRESWKPGLAVSVSAGCGETPTSQYLADVLRIFGAYPVGTFTAQAVGPGEFLGQGAVEARAKSLARDLAEALESQERYPATDRDLTFWHFMGNLVKENKELMGADYEHWEKAGLFDSFEKYTGHTRTVSPWNTPEVRKEWFKSIAKKKE